MPHQVAWLIFGLASYAVFATALAATFWREARRYERLLDQRCEGDAYNKGLKLGVKLGALSINEATYLAKVGKAGI